MENEALQQLREQYGSNPNIKANSVAGLMEYAMHLETAVLAMREAFEAVSDRAIEYGNKHGIGFPNPTRDMALWDVVVDAERLRTENTAMRGALRMARHEIVDTAQDEESMNAVIEFIDSALQPVMPRYVKPVETAPEPAPATIKVGDRVRITSGMHEGLTGVVTKAGGGKSSILMKPDNGDMSREFPLFKVERI